MSVNELGKTNGPKRGNGALLAGDTGAQAPVRPARLGLIAAGALAAALAILGPFSHVDEEVAGRVHLETGGETTAVTAITVDGAAEAIDVARIARRAGAAGVILPGDAIPAGHGVAADPRRVEGKAVLDGRVPSDVLSGAVVVIDDATRAVPRARQAARVEIGRLGQGGGVASAIIAALLAFTCALAASRLRPRVATMVIVASILVTAAGMAAAAAAGVVVPGMEVALAAIIGGIGGALDAGTELRRAVRAASGPVLRAVAQTAGAPSDLGPGAGVGPALAELLGARSLLLLETPPGCKKAAASAGFRLRAADLKKDARLDPRLAPFRDPRGIARPADGGALLEDGAPATLLPLVHAGVVEGFLLCSGPEAVGLADNVPATAQAACQAIARGLQGARLRGRKPGSFTLPSRNEARLLVDASRALEGQVVALHAAAEHAGTGLLLATPAGATLWKNGAVDGAMTGVAPEVSSDLARCLTLARRPGERLAGAMERVMSSAEPTVVHAPERKLVLTFTPIRPMPGLPATALFVEAMPELDATCALAPLIAPAQAVVGPMAAAGSSHGALISYPTGR